MNASLFNVEYDALQAVVEGIEARYKARGFWTPGLQAAGLPLKVCDPHRVAFLQFSHVLARTSQPHSPPPSSEVATQILRESATMQGWRFLVYGQDAKPIAAAHAVIDPRRGEYRLAELNEGSYVQGIPEAAMAAQKFFIERKSPLPVPYDFLLLVVPSLFTAALWLRNQNIPDASENEGAVNLQIDYLVPILPNGDGSFRKFDVLDPSQFFESLQKVKPADGDTDQ
jgi:hypothetical protein